MEEILASIRRIIADDESFSGARRPPTERRQSDAPPANDAPAPVVQPVALDGAAEAQEPAQIAEIRQLRLNRAEPEAPEAVVYAEELEPALEEEAEAHADEAELSEPLVVAQFEHSSLAESDYSSQADYSRQADYSSADEVLAGFDPADAAPLVSPDAAASIATHFQALATSMFINDSGLLQKYAQEMLRPMLKQWLDDNLPVIVERLVRAEIERVARGGRR
jgi:cell pole-organizing protein PopZ